MTITLSQNTIPLNKMMRTFNNSINIAGYLREGCDVLNPEIEIEYNSNFLQYNYCYIPVTGRYYYFSKPPAIDGKKMILFLHVDVLYTYKNVIQNSQCIAKRSSSNYDVNLPDPADLNENGWVYYSGVLPFTFTPQSGTYILSCSGGGQ